MDLELEGKVAWVLGASSGLGKATALSLARERATVAMSSRDRGRLDEAASDIEDSTGTRPLVVPLDVIDEHAITTSAEQVVGEAGGIDVLVSNAGGPPPGTFDDFSDDDLASGFTLTTGSAWRLAKAVLPSMRARGGGCIAFLTSSSTKEVVPGLLLSNMMRAAVVGMAKTLSKELAADGIRVLCVAPGRIDTDRLKALDEATARRTGRPADEVRAANQSLIPLGRYGRPEEFGDVVAFLVSHRASYISGITVLVDGGLLNGVLS